MIVYVNTEPPYKKAKKVTRKQRELQASWLALLTKYDTSNVVTTSTIAKQSNIVVRQVASNPSLQTTAGNCNKSPIKVYTGNAIIGLSTMHKSNIVPVFSQAEAEAHAKMRRG